MGEPKKSPPRPVAAGTRLSPPKLFTHFGLLDHTLYDTDAGFWTPTGVRRDDALQRELDLMISRRPGDWAGLRVALVDLSGGAPRFAGNGFVKGTEHVKPGEVVSPAERCLETWEAASTNKLAVLYAAFQLRWEVTELAELYADKTPKWMFDKLRIKWLASQVIDESLPIEVLRADAPKIERRGHEIRVDGKRIPLKLSDGTVIGPPKLEQILDVTKTALGWKVRFKGEPDGWGSDPEVAQTFQNRLEKVAKAFASPLPAGRSFTFFEKLWLMADASHNHATDQVLGAIGFLYVNSLMWRSGLFEPRRGGGMWVGRHYAHASWWAAPPGPALRTRDGDLIRAGMSAASGVAYMTLLHQNKLAGYIASQQIRVLLDRSSRRITTGSATVYDIQRLDRGFWIESVHAKIGLGSFSNYFDASLAIVHARSQTFKYSACVLDISVADDISTPLFDCIDPPRPWMKITPQPPVPDPPPAPEGDDEEYEEEEE
ncbi:MAG: hypothetical protein IAG13_34445 [Deltaproteobacteria bacterium]|nr:hypothetical protein [Nannocystaceae bacterium]